MFKLSNKDTMKYFLKAKIRTHKDRPVTFFGLFIFNPFQVIVSFLRHDLFPPNGGILSFFSGNILGVISY